MNADQPWSHPANNTQYQPPAPKKRKGKILLIATAGIIGIALATTAGGEGAQKAEAEPKPAAGAKQEPKDDGTISLAEYEQIKPGMTLAEVEKIAGTDHEWVSESEIGDQSSKLLQYKGDKFASIATMTFTNGELLSKSQAGLK